MECLAAAAERYGVEAFYAFGSRGTEVAAWVRGHGVLNRASMADVDIGVLPASGHGFDLDDRVGLAGDLERLFAAPRVDVVVLPLAAPYVALDVISGELLFCADRVREAEFQLFVLRRAGDLAPVERARRRHLLSGLRP